VSEYIFKLPDLGEGTVESEIGEWNVKIGDVIGEDTIVGTMMTDKAAVELNSPVAGKVVSLAGEPGDMIAVGAPLVVFETDGKTPQAEADVPAEAVTAPESQSDHPVSTSTAVQNGKVITSPAIRRRAKEAGIDLSTIPGSGAGGRILRRDLDSHLDSHLDSLHSDKSPAPSPAKPVTTEEIKVIGLRRVIAERMSQANREIPHFAYVEEIDITELEELRKHLNTDRAERLTLLPFLSLALMRALQEFPQCNTTYDKERNVLQRHGAVHLGIATQTPDGLKVPVVRNANQLNIDSLSREIKRLSEAARNNSARKDELSGSTITITSLGKLGGIVSTPVINQPEVSIIGVNKAVERPVVLDGQVTVRLMMNLSSSFDHRFVDGYDAAAMIQRIKDMLEHPATIFMD
jgi:2-oxoisovalerate dehydrogenase E2 component (dihydrolipoyl transacylase)